MVITQARPKRKGTGSVYKDYRKKRSYEKGRLPTLTKLGQTKVKTIRILGNNVKSIYLQVNTVNLYDPKAKKYHKTDIKAILENTSNPNLVRRNIITKGCVIQTEKGKAKVTSRPGQDGTLNAVLI